MDTWNYSVSFFDTKYSKKKILFGQLKVRIGQRVLVTVSISS